METTEKVKRDKTIINIFIYLLSVILVISYFFILYISMNPKVSWEYNLYYIKQETDIWPGMHGYDYEIDTKIETNLENKENCKRFGKGWLIYTPSGLLSTGNESKIYFGNLPNKELVFEMEACPNKEVEMYFNDRLVMKIDSNNIMQETKIVEEVKREDIINGRLIITFKYAEIEEDEKTSGILCKRINLYEIS